MQVPTYKKFLRDILSRKRVVPPVETVALIESHLVGDKYPKKHEDPGTPTITCYIGGAEVRNALCDLGAGVSVMPFSLYKRLKLGDYSPTSITLQMADKTRKQPVGMIEDVLVRIDEQVMPIPTDFIILDILEDNKLSIILGRLFLSTAGASMDCVEGKFAFSVYGKEIIRYFTKKGEQRDRYVTPSKKNEFSKCSLNRTTQGKNEKLDS